MNSSRISSKWSLCVLLAVLLAALPFFQAPQSASAQDAGGEGADAAGADAASLAAFQRFWPTTATNTENASVAIDKNGGVHMAFTSYTSYNGGYPIFYGYCAANCGVKTSWTITTVGNAGMYGGFVLLEVDPSNRPRMVLYQQVNLLDDGQYQYAQCNSGCTAASGWTIVSLQVVAAGPDATRYFTLDAQGRPRFLYNDTDSVNDHRGTYYAYCDSGCTSKANWHETEISESYLLYDFSLAFTSSGGVRMAYRNAAGYPDTLNYVECGSTCTDANNWNEVPLVNPLGSGGSFALDLDTQGRPRIAYYTGYISSTSADNDLLWYAWCNSSCLQAGSWTHRSAGLPKGYGEYVDFVVDAQNKLHFAYLVDDTTNSIYGMGYTVCTANCTGSTAPTWSDQMVETGDDLNASDPVAVQSGCSISAWLDVGEEPSLAVDALGQPRVGYNAVHYQGGTCSIHEDIRLVRYGQLGNAVPPVPKPYRVFMPMLKK